MRPPRRPTNSQGYVGGAFRAHLRDARGPKPWELSGNDWRWIIFAVACVAAQVLLWRL